MPSKQKRVKPVRKRVTPVTGWTIVLRGMFAWLRPTDHISRSRESAIAEWTAYNEMWQYWYRRGYRCVRVTVQEATR